MTDNQSPPREPLQQAPSEPVAMIRDGVLGWHIASVHHAVPPRLLTGTHALYAEPVVQQAPQPAPAVAVEAADQPSYMTWNLHPRTADLVHRFSYALAGKLAAAEKKYGYSDGWADPDWMDECREKLTEHVAKGDPRDVAAYCAFLWHHGASTAPSGPSMKTIADLAGVFDEGARQGAALAARSAPAVAESQWRTMESAARDGTELLLWREDCGQFIGSYTSGDAFPLTQDEIDMMAEEVLFQKDWFTQWPDARRLEGSELPALWRHLPADPGIGSGSAQEGQAQ